MAGWTKRVAMVAVGALALTMLGGCNNDMKAENARLKGEVEQLRTENQSLAQQNQATQAQVQQMQGTIASLQQAQAAPAPAPAGTLGGGSTRAGRAGGEVITVAGDVAFGSGQATLTAAGRRELDQIAAKIRREYPGNGLRITGYTDSDPIRKSRWGSNEALSQARAEAVEKYLQSKGLSNPMESIGMGSANPKSTKAASRRVEIKILGN
jgi:outer membrane protein OmpA-like peptidoglycan-associated protein